MTFYCNLHDLT